MASIRATCSAVLLILFASGCGTSDGEPERRDRRANQALQCASPGCTCSDAYAIGFVQSTFGGQGDFELVVPAAEGGLAHLERANSRGEEEYPWSRRTLFGSGDVAGARLIQDRNTGSLEVIARVSSNLVHYWRSATGQSWGGPFVIASGVSGTPGFTQSTFGTNGHYEVVVPLAAGGLAHFRRNNDDPALPWSRVGTVSQFIAYSDVALIQSSYGNLEVMARVSSEIHHYWSAGSASTWFGGMRVGTGVSGSPGFAQTTLGTAGTFEVVTPMASGGIAQFTRNDALSGMPWTGPLWVTTQGTASAVALIQSNFFTAGRGNLEFVARLDGELRSAWRDNDTTTWSLYPFGAEPCCDPKRKGRWEQAVDGGVPGLHTTLLRTGKVLFVGYNGFDAAGSPDSRVFDPATFALTPTNIGSLPHQPHVFCSGHAAMPGGKLLFAGGHHHALDKLNIFDPLGDANGVQWTQADMGKNRWYPTVTTLPSGLMFIISGSTPPDFNPPLVPEPTWQLFTPSTGRVGPPMQVPSFRYPGGDGAIDTYPFVFVLPNGKLAVHSRNVTRFVTPATNTWDSTQVSAAIPRTYPNQGAAVLLPLLPDATPAYRASIAVFGGAGPSPVDVTTPATDTIDLLDLGQTDPTKWAWQSGGTMQRARVMADAVLLPDGKVLIVSGSATGQTTFAALPVLSAELYDPSTRASTLLCSMRTPRLYHATAILLPDARVLVAGTDAGNNPKPYKYPNTTVEIFRPPYLDKSGFRPTIGTVPASWSPNAALTIPVGGVTGFSIRSAALIRMGSVTHSLNMDQRFVGLAITQRGIGSIAVKAPPNHNVVPPGYYMLFVVSTDGVPSIAKIVRLT